MSHTSKVLRFFVAAMMLAGLAFPAIAADKLLLLSAKVFTTTGVPIGAVIPTGQTSILLLDFANQSPNVASSVFKSVQAVPPPDVTYKIVQTNVVNNGATCPASPTYTPAAVPVPNATGTITINGIGGQGVKPTGHYCLYLAVTSSLSTCTAKTWTGRANTGTNFGGGTAFFDANNQLNDFATASTTDGCTGVLGCDSTNNKGGTLDPTQDIAYFDPGVGVVRAQNINDPFVACTVVPYQLNFDPANDTASFVVTDGAKGNQQISVEYVLVGNPVPIDSNGWTARRPKLAWGVLPHDPPTFPTDYVPGLACLDDDVNGGSAVMPFIPNAPPFDNPLNWPAGTYPQYQPGVKAKMCVAQLGWTSVGGQIIYWFKIIDQSDGYVNFSE